MDLIVFVMLIAGTVFAYGVTSSGKTHTMHVCANVENPKFGIFGVWFYLA